jgi:DNA-directed RNA polymerase sigma subunit (sigma70/sigma32)
MAGSLTWIGEAWPTDDGWPYPDVEEEPDALDVDAELDDDLVSLHALAPHLFDDLSPLERLVICSRFGLDGRTAVSMKSLQQELGLSRAELRGALGGGLGKLRTHLLA